MSGTAGFCLPTGCVILNRCMCSLVPSGLGIFPNLLFVPFYTSRSEIAMCLCVCGCDCVCVLVTVSVVFSGVVPGQAGPV